MDKQYVVYEYGSLKDIFRTLDEAIDCAEYLCDTESCHIQVIDIDTEARSYCSDWHLHIFN